MESHRVLVTGCSGFLGRHVATALLERGHEVAGFDLSIPKYRIPTFSQGDFTAKPAIIDALRQVSAVCHLGGVGDVYLAESDPALAFRMNAIGTKTVCDAALEVGTAKLIYASTWEVYGKAQYNPVDETHPCNPDTPYSISKLAGELIAKRAGNESSLVVTILRIGTAYGQFMRESAVISAFLAQAHGGGPLSVHGKGDQFRQFTHAKDVANAFSLALDSKEGSEIYNVVADEKITVLELAEMVAAHFDIDIEFRAGRPGDPLSAIISSEKAKRRLGWRPQIAFREGLEELVAKYDRTSRRM